MDQDKEYRRARAKVASQKALILHFTIFAFISFMLLVLNIMTSTKVIWFHWPVFGWSIGVAFHAMAVYLFSGNAVSKWEKRKIDELMETKG